MKTLIVVFAIVQILKKKITVTYLSRLLSTYFEVRNLSRVSAVLKSLGVHGENERWTFDLKFLQLFKRKLFCFVFPTADLMENIEDIRKVTLYYFLCEVRTVSLHKAWLFYRAPALPQLGRLSAALSPGMPGFHPKAFHARRVVD
jgi:hypothetical protein